MIRLVQPLSHTCFRCGHASMTSFCTVLIEEHRCETGVVGQGLEGNEHAPHQTSFRNARGGDLRNVEEVVGLNGLDSRGFHGWMRRLFGMRRGLGTPRRQSPRPS